MTIDEYDENKLYNSLIKYDSSNYIEDLFKNLKILYHYENNDDAIKNTIKILLTFHIEKLSNDYKNDKTSYEDAKNDFNGIIARLIENINFVDDVTSSMRKKLEDELKKVKDEKYVYKNKINLNIESSYQDSYQIVKKR